MNPQLSIPQAKLQAFCRTHAVRKLSDFGSALQRMRDELVYGDEIKLCFG